MAALRWIVDVMVRIDPGLWYLIDLRERSALSWLPAVLMAALLMFVSVQCLLAANIGGGLVLSALALTLFIVKWRRSAQA
jgi:hypothetical protein